MKDDLFSTTEQRAIEFAENIWFSQLLTETVENLIKYETDHAAALKLNDEKLIKQTRLQLDATISSLQLAAHFNETPDGFLND
jgi:acetylglutamate kinase